MDELNGLPYLDAVVRETMRIYSVVASTIRIAEEDDIIPVSAPYTDRKGRTMHEIRSACNASATASFQLLLQSTKRRHYFPATPRFESRGTHLGRGLALVPVSVRAAAIPTLGLTPLRPERWQTVPEKANSIPGVFSGLASFIGGPRSCIG